jgi:hypothetical protein
MQGSSVRMRTNGSRTPSTFPKATRTSSPARSPGCDSAGSRASCNGSGLAREARGRLSYNTTTGPPRECVAIAGHPLPATTQQGIVMGKYVIAWAFCFPLAAVLGARSSRDFRPSVSSRVRRCTGKRGPGTRIPRRSEVTSAFGRRNPWFDRPVWVGLERMRRLTAARRCVRCAPVSGRLDGEWHATLRAGRPKRRDHSPIHRTRP